MIWKYVDLFVKKHISKPRAISIADSNIEKQKKVIIRLENVPEDVFNEEQAVLINDIGQLRIISSFDYSGAYGEIQVLKELKKLHDSYHVLCDVKIRLKD